MPQLTLRALRGEFAVCKAAPGAAVETPVRAELFSLTRTALETSVVCAASEVPDGFVAELGWSALAVSGTLDFSLVGILAGLTACLARAEVSVFALSTFDTDLLLVRTADLEGAVAALRADGHTVLDR